MGIAYSSWQALLCLWLTRKWKVVALLADLCIAGETACEQEEAQGMPSHIDFASSPTTLCLRQLVFIVSTRAHPLSSTLRAWLCVLVPGDACLSVIESQ